jgi:hypothetical protein
MSWFKDPGGHIIQSKNRIHRLLFCPLCGHGGKPVSKYDCC